MFACVFNDFSLSIFRDFACTRRRTEVQAVQNRFPKGGSMARIDKVLGKYDLRTLETLVENRRRQESKKLAMLKAKKKKLESTLQRIERELAQASQPVAGKPSGARGQAKPKRRPNARRLNEITLADALETVFRRRKNPIHYKELTQLVRKRGLYKTRSKNLLSTVAVTLKRDRRFKKVEPGVFALRKR